MTVVYNGSFTGDPAVGEEVLTVGTVNGRVASYVWGPDIASRPDGHSSWQRAGGVGGLLMVVDGNGTWPGIPVTTDDHYFPLMDRLGNVTGCRKAATGLPNDSLSAVLEYDAFGQEVRSTGPASDLVPFHFSTKFTDQESGLNYYGYRYYDSGKGRWLSRDPMGEMAGRNLLAFAANHAVQCVDVLGANPIDIGAYNPPPDDAVKIKQLIDERSAMEAESKLFKNVALVSSLEDLIRQIQQIKEKNGPDCCVSTLNLHTHGSWGGMGGMKFRPRKQAGQEEGHFGAKAGARFGAALKQHMCNPCQINLRGCAALGDPSLSPDPEARAFVIELAKASGCHVLGTSKINTTRITSNETGGVTTSGTTFENGENITETTPDGEQKQLPNTRAGGGKWPSVLPGAK